MNGKMPFVMQNDKCQETQSDESYLFLMAHTYVNAHKCQMRLN